MRNYDKYPPKPGIWLDEEIESSPPAGNKQVSPKDTIIQRAEKAFTTQTRQHQGCASIDELKNMGFKPVCDRKAEILGRKLIMDQLPKSPAFKKRRNRMMNKLITPPVTAFVILLIYLLASAAISETMLFADSFNVNLVYVLIILEVICTIGGMRFGSKFTRREWEWVSGDFKDHFSNPSIPKDVVELAVNIREHWDQNQHMNLQYTFLRHYADSALLKDYTEEHDICGFLTLSTYNPYGFAVFAYWEDGQMKQLSLGGVSQPLPAFGQ